MSNRLDNLTEEVHINDCNCFLEYESVNGNSIKYKFLSCNKSYSNKIDEELKSRFNNTFKFPNNGINKFILLLKKGVYSYEYMDEWEKFNSIQDGPFRGHFGTVIPYLKKTPKIHESRDKSLDFC